MKNSPSAELAAAAHKVARRGKYVSEKLGEALVTNFDPKANLLPHERLSPREFEVLRSIDPCGERRRRCGNALWGRTASNHRQRVRLGPPRKGLIDPREFGAAEAEVAGAGVLRSVIG
jgi:hypothetical protein